MHQSKTLQNRTYPLLSSWLTGQGNSQHCTNRPYDRLSTEQPSSARYGLKSFLSCFCCYCFFIFGWLVWFGQLVDVCDVLFVCLSVCWGGGEGQKEEVQANFSFIFLYLHKKGHSLANLPKFYSELASHSRGVQDGIK